MTVDELHSIYMQHDGELSWKQMLSQLSSLFEDEMLVIHVEGYITLVGFTKCVSRSLKNWVNQLVRRVKAEVIAIPLPRDFNLQY